MSTISKSLDSIHRIQLLNFARRRSLTGRGTAARYKTCGRRVAISSAVGRGRNGSEAGSAHRQHAQPYWIRVVRHLDVKWLWTREAVQAVRFTLNMVGTYSNVTDLTTLGRLRHTRGHGDAVSTANEGQTAVVNAERRPQPIQLDKNVLSLWIGISSLANPSRRERRELGELRFESRRGCYINNWTEGRIRTVSLEYDALGLQAVYGY